MRCVLQIESAALDLLWLQDSQVLIVTLSTVLSAVNTDFFKKGKTGSRPEQIVGVIPIITPNMYGDILNPNSLEDERVSLT